MKTSMTFGLLASATGIVLWLIAGIVGLQYLITEEQIYLTLPFVFWFSILATGKRKREESITFNYIECLKTSLVLGVIAGLMLAVFNFAYYTLVAHGVVEALARNAMDKSPASVKLDQLNREEIIDRAVWLAIIDSSITYLIGIFLYSMIFGAIAGVFMRTKANLNEEIAKA